MRGEKSTSHAKIQTCRFPLQIFANSEIPRPFGLVGLTLSSENINWDCCTPYDTHLRKKTPVMPSQWNKSWCKTIHKKLCDTGTFIFIQIILIFTWDLKVAHLSQVITPQKFIRLPRQFTCTHLCPWVERGTVRVKYLAQEHNNCE